MSHIVIEGRTLAKAMKSAVTVIEKRTNIPILNCARLALDGPALRISATDLDMQLDMKVDLIEASDAFDVCIPAHLLYKIAADAGPALIRMTAEVQEHSRDVAKTRTTEAHKETWTKRVVILDVADGDAVYNLEAQDPADFPNMLERFSKLQLAEAGTFTNGQLAEIFERVSLTISTEETRYYLNGINYRPGLFQATDGHRLYRHVFDKAAAENKTFDLIIPRKACGIIASHAKKETAVKYATGNGPYMTFSFGSGVRLLTKGIDGTFPDIDRVIPKEANYAFEFDADQFRQAVKRATAISDQRGRTIKLFNRDGKVCISVANPDLGDVVARTFADWPADAQECGFNGAYVMAFIPKSGKMRFIAESQNAPYIIKHVSDVDDDEANTRVLMPMRV